MRTWRTARGVAVAQLALVRRHKGWLAVSAAITFGVGAVSPLAGELPLPTAEAPAAAPAPTAEPRPPWRPVDPCRGLPPVAVEGALPVQLPAGWPQVPLAEADLLLRVDTTGGGGGLEVVELAPGAAAWADLCLAALLEAHRVETEAALGLPSAEPWVEAAPWMEIPRPGGPLPTRLPRLLPALLLGVVSLNGLGVLAGALPRWRSAGALESIRVSPAPTRGLVLGGLLAALVAGSLMGLVALAGAVTGAALGGAPVDLPGQAALLPLAALALLALGQRMMITAPDARGAAFRIVGLQLGLGVLGGLWSALGQLGHGVAQVLVPVVGIGALATGATPVSGGGVALGLLGMAGAVAGLVAWSAWTLARDPLEGGDPTARRRARGALLPEAVVLVLVALGGSSWWSLPAAMRSAWAGLLLGQVGFMAVPALAVPRLLAVPAAPLLGLVRPRLRAWLAVPLVVLATAGLSALALALGDGLADPLQKAAAERLSGTLLDLARGPGLLLLTVLPAVCEELLFRGAVLGMLRRGRPTWVAVGLQALAFAALHGMALRFLPTFAVGLVLGALRVRTGSVWPGAAVHALHNALLLWIASQGVEAVADLPPGPALGALGAAAVVGLVATWGAGDGSDTAQ